MSAVEGREGRDVHVREAMSKVQMSVRAEVESREARPEQMMRVPWGLVSAVVLPMREGTFARVFVIDSLYVDAGEPGLPGGSGCSLAAAPCWYRADGYDVPDSESRKLQCKLVVLKTHTLPFSSRTCISLSVPPNT